MNTSSALTPTVMGVVPVLLAGLGLRAASLGGAPVLRGAVRVAFWGAVAMAVTSLVGRMVGAVG